MQYARDVFSARAQIKRSWQAGYCADVGADEDLLHLHIWRVIQELDKKDTQEYALLLEPWTVYLHTIPCIRQGFRSKDRERDI